MTIQWKVNGSLVGAINQIIYGVAFYLMEKISGDENRPIKTVFCDVFSRNVQFDVQLGHHIYLFPTENTFITLPTQ